MREDTAHTQAVRQVGRSDAAPNEAPRTTEGSGLRHTPFSTRIGSAPQDPERCFGSNDPLLAKYHDTEWAVPIHDEAGLLEMVTLLGFQAGLNWLQILRKRPALREAFRDFDPYAVAALTDSDLHQLAKQPQLIRNPVKLAAARNNAHAVVRLHEEDTSLEELLWAHAPPVRPHPPDRWSDVPIQTTESTALARTLKSHGFRFVGPVSCYALLQSCGVINDHLSNCPVNT